MGIWILTQNKRSLVLVYEIKLAGAKVTGYSKRRSMGMLLGKYGDENRSNSVFQKIASKLKESPAINAFFEMPGSEGGY
ncbi:hypothetical protein ES703_104680 [subsurface metagenome]